LYRWWHGCCGYFRIRIRNCNIAVIDFRQRQVLDRVMKLLFLRKITLPFLALCHLASCATTTEEGAVGVSRQQMLLVSSEEINAAAAQSYEQTKEEARKKNSLDKNPEQVKRVVAVAQRLIPQTAIFRKDAPKWAWETHVISSPEVNAYCMPGGKIMFYSGIIDQLKLTDAEIAAVMGHEISHALREHGRERMTEEMAKQGLIGIFVVTGIVDEKYAGAVNALSTVLVSLRFSRKQESEADEMGLELMARAGYNPQEAVNLWKKMESVGGSKPPEFLSTHPADDRRIEDIQRLLPKVMPLYDKAKKY
jgi:predicted Zn-dependent protease